MQWLILLTVALGLVAFGKYLKSSDEVHTLALYSAGILSTLWGFAIAPTSAQLTISIFALAWVQVSSLRA